MDTWSWIAIAVAITLLLLVLIGSRWRVRRHRRRLEETFGPEYQRAVARSAKRQDAEKELREQERRHEEIELHELAGPDAGPARGGVAPTAGAVPR
jgi:flagellar biosynthesis/type III secretory pathway M-ring protein FliF/YscJ